MYTKKDFKLLSQFFNSSATDKQRYYINNILKKSQPSAWDKKLIDDCIRSMNVQLTNVSMTVDERLHRYRNTLKVSKYKGDEV